METKELYGKEWREQLRTKSKEELIDYLEIACKELNNLKKEKYFKK